MRKMSEVFELPVIPPTTQETVGMTDRQVDRMTCAAHAINHADALADALEEALEIMQGDGMDVYEYFNELSDKLRAYRGEQ